jgi:nucleoside-diphosphate-sugar epimerase
MTAAVAIPSIGLFRDDLESVVERTRAVWESLRSARLFITGGTGFLGKWLTETFVFANRELDLGAELVLLSRDPQRFLHSMPHLRQSDSLSLIEGDVRTFDFPRGVFSHVIHGATEASASLNETSPQTMFDVIVEGTRRTLDFCEACGAQRLLMISSGAVYGRQPATLSHIHEDYLGAPDPLAPASAYGEGKRVAEMLCAMAQARFGLEVAIARCFAFVGPHLPFDRHFAVGNFLRDALDVRPIAISGDGRPLRSYMYAADLAVWLWTILVRGTSGRAYNVGSEHVISIRELALKVAAQTGVTVYPPDTHGNDATNPVSRYVPSTRRATFELGLTTETNLGAAIARTLAWHTERESASEMPSTASIQN